MHTDAAVATREPQVYFDEPGDAELAVPAGEHQTDLEAALGIDDGLLDTGAVMPADATATAYTEPDADAGPADPRDRVDEAREIVDRASAEEHRAPGEIVVPTPDGELAAGPATADTDGDGTADTVLVSDPGGDTLLYTDSDGDGVADLATQITADGHVVVSEHTGDGEWTVLERSRLGEPADGGGTPEDGWNPTGAATVSVDPATGLWVRR